MRVKFDDDKTNKFDINTKEIKKAYSLFYQKKKYKMNIIIDILYLY